eukprot:5019969-Prorocentrum_lima.AAC.1
MRTQLGDATLASWCHLCHIASRCACNCSSSRNGRVGQEGGANAGTMGNWAKNSIVVGRRPASQAS